jgi:hypothetical protein
MWHGPYPRGAPACLGHLAWNLVYIKQWKSGWQTDTALCSVRHVSNDVWSQSANPSSRYTMCILPTYRSTDRPTDQPTNQPTPMKESPSWEANNHSASQQIPRLLWNPKVHCPPLVLILSHMHTVHTIPPYFPRSILILSSHQRVVFKLDSSLQVFRPKLCTRFSSLPWVLRKLEKLGCFAKSNSEFLPILYGFETRSLWGHNTDWETLRTKCWGEYLDLWTRK